MKTTVLAFLFLVSFSAQAQDTDKMQPCMEIKKACEGAGFKSGLSRGKVKDGSVKDCMYKITNGESVSGVSVSASVINGCKEKHEK